MCLGRETATQVRCAVSAGTGIDTSRGDPNLVEKGHDR
ncbi:hypothetical protein SAMN05444161_1489 [Rhizobiales bacterium GAS191]|nr:hypothetical protein SAMN05444161_1489 [Rhizobiales bacterium GAS191]